MRFVIQRVNHANVKIDGKVVGNIGHGLLILFGAGQDDTEEMLPKYVDKICKMRIFEDENVSYRRAAGWHGEQSFLTGSAS